jgi:RHS repeat-associated protein
MTANLGGAGWYQAAYTYDGLGNRTSAVQRDAKGTRSRSWTYPTPGLGVVRPHAPTQVSDQVGSATPVTATPSYTAAGDQTSRLRLSAPGPNGGDIVAAAHQTLSYDTEGRLASVTTGAGGSAVTTSYLYDADGALLVTDSPTERTVHLSGDREVSRDKTTNLRSTTEVTTVGSVTVVETGTEQVSTTVTPGPGETTTRIAEPVTTRAVTITDPHNTGVLQLNAQTLEVTGRRYSDPFGAPVGTLGLEVGSWVGDRGFVNGHVDVGSGLVQLGARVYDPASGVFTEPDPILDPSNPAQMHGVYAYAWNNPLTFADPTGTEPRPIHNRNNKKPKPSDFEAPGYRWGGQASHATSTARNNGHRASGARYTAQAAVTPRVEPTTVQRKRTESRRDVAASSRAPRPQRVPNEFAAAGQVGWEAGPGFLAWYGKYGNIFGWLGLNNRAYDEARSWERGLQTWGGADTSSSSYQDIYWGGSIAMVFVPGPGGGEVNLVRGGTRVVTRGGLGPVRAGQAGEAAVRSAYDVGPKVTVRVSGRTRILDGLNAEAVSEVKNVNYQAYTQQLKDGVTYAQQNGLRYDLYVRGGANPTTLSGPLEAAVRSGEISLRTIP